MSRIPTPACVALAYSVDSRRRNRATFLQGRPATVEFLAGKWQRGYDYRLIKQLWAFHDNRNSVRFAYEWLDAEGRWFRSYGNENWEFDAHGLMRLRHAIINGLALRTEDRLFDRPLGRRPHLDPSLDDLGL